MLTDIYHNKKINHWIPVDGTYAHLMTSNRDNNVGNENDSITDNHHDHSNYINSAVWIEFKTNKKNIGIMGLITLSNDVLYNNKDDDCDDDSSRCSYNFGNISGNSTHRSSNNEYNNDFKKYFSHNNNTFNYKSNARTNAMIRRIQDDSMCLRTGGASFIILIYESSSISPILS